MLLFYLHACFYLCHADADIGLSVYGHKTGRTVSDGTEEASRTVQLRAVSQDTDTGCMKCSGDSFLRVPFHFLTVIEESNLFSP